MHNEVNSSGMEIKETPLINDLSGSFLNKCCKQLHNKLQEKDDRLFLLEKQLNFFLYPCLSTYLLCGHAEPFKGRTGEY